VSPQAIMPVLLIRLLMQQFLSKHPGAGKRESFEIKCWLSDSI
jgi:hypothetical protein